MGILQDLQEIFPVLAGGEVPLAIKQTLEACWPNDKRPQIHSKKRTELGWEFSFGLQPGISFRDFASREEYFRDAIGNVTTEIIRTGKTATLKIITQSIPKFKAYADDFDRGNMILPIPIGCTHSGLVLVDLAGVPHILIGGITGGGKSNEIHVIVNSLLGLKRPPKIILVDLKQSEYNYLENYVMLVTEKDMANKVLVRLVAEMRKRQALLKQSKCVNIQKYNNKYDYMDYIVLIIDELAELTDAAAQENLETLLRLCRASGICIISATQRPSSTMFSKKSFADCKANYRGRLCFQTADAVNSKIILDSVEAANLPNIPGRAIWKLDKPIEVQTPYLDPEKAEVLLNAKLPPNRIDPRQITT
jgi:S-DNA-T family DNA segregation ATPase FtsK/SpoIIIE